MTTTVALQQARKRVASVVPLLFALLLWTASPAAAHHIAGATYDGTHAQGGTVSFTVTPDGTGISSVTVNGTLQGDTCHVHRNHVDLRAAVAHHQPRVQ